MQILEFKRNSVILAGWRRRPKAGLVYGEILTAERLRQPWRGLRLHVRIREPIVISCHGERQREIEDELRRRGVRIVDEYGAMITPTLADFEAELAREPVGMGQSSDNA